MSPSSPRRPQQILVPMEVGIPDAEAVVRMAKEIGSTLTVLGKREYTLWERLRAGCPVEEISRKASCPVRFVYETAKAP